MPRAWLATKQPGFSLVEVILSSAVFGLLVTALVGAYLYGQESTTLAGNRARATLLAEEGLEAVRNIRDPAFVNLTDGTYGLTTTSNQWNLSGSSDTNGIFTRQVIVSSVDSKRKSVTANVTWQQNPQRTGTVSLATRLTNWIAAGSGNWALATSSGSLDLSGNQDGLKLQVQGNYAYLIRSNTSSNFVVIDISNPGGPALVSTISITGTPTNLFVSGNYAYVTSDNNSQELQIVNIATPSAPSVVGSYNAPGNSDANGVYVVGSTAYIVRVNSASDELAIVNVTVPTLPTQLGALDLGTTGYEVVVSGNYAFVATGSNGNEMQVINISNPLLPVLSGSLNLPSNADATTIALSGATLLLGQGSNFRTVSIANPLAPALLGTLAISGNVNDIALDSAGNYVFLVTQATAAEFQVVDITTVATPILSATVNISGASPLSGVAYSATSDRVYGAGQSNTEELSVFAPQ